MKTVFDVCYNKETEQYLDVYLPDAEEFAVVLYFHGGGLVSGDKTNGKNFFSYMVSNNVAVVSANYRTYPKALYPDFLEDAAAATSWVFKNMNKYGKIKGIYIAGSSAGGYISQMLCFDEKWLSKYNIKPIDISGFIHDAGQPTCHFNVLAERGLDTRRVIIDESAPLYHVGESEKYPPMLIIVSDNDLPNRYEQTMLLISTLKQFGHFEKVKLKVMNGGHCAYVDALDERNQSVFGGLLTGFINQ